VDPHLQVPVAHDGGVGDLNVAGADDRFGVAGPEGGKPVELRNEIVGDPVEGALGVDVRFLDEFLDDQSLLDDVPEHLAQRLDVTFLHRDPGRIAVPPVGEKQRVAELEPLVKVELRDAPSGTLSDAVLEADEDRGPVEAVDDPRGDDPDHAGVPLR